MLTRIRWRILLPFFLLLIAGSASLVYALTRPGCVGDPACITRTVVIIGAAGLAAAAVLAWLIGEQTARPIRELTQAAGRIASGEVTVRALPRTHDDEVGELTRAFNRMVEHSREQLDGLSEDRQRFAAVLDHMADGVLITDNLSYVSLINPAAERLLQTTEAEALGRSFASVVRHFQLIELWQRCREQGREQIEAVELGPDLFLQAVVTPFRQKGAPGYLVILQDLTQVRRLQTMRRDFISNLSHELRTPLASLRAVVETLQDGALIDPAAAERFLARAEREVDTMSQMVEELLELSQIESGQTQLRLAPTAVSDLLLTPVERLRGQAERGELSLVLDVPLDLPKVLVDGDRIQQVVTNLLHNAIKFTPPGGTIRIRAYAARPESGANEEVIIEVQDSGIGIPKQDLSRIFERFYKSDRARTRSRGGTGLGLAIARHIVQAHGGRIWVKSKEGRGSAFYFSLPTAAP